MQIDARHVVLWVLAELHRAQRGREDLLDPAWRRKADDVRGYRRESHTIPMDRERRRGPQGR